MKLSILKLAGIFVILIGAYVAINIFGNKTKSKSVRTELVNLDEDKVDYLSVQSSTQSVELSKTGNQWSVKLSNDKSVPADSNSVSRAIQALTQIKPSRMVSNKKEKWTEYQVDSTGTRVIAKSNGSSVLDIVLGKLGMTGQNSFHSYVRLSEDNQTYLVNNFMSFNVPSDPNNYRVNKLSDFKKGSLVSAKFLYKGDSSFIIEQMNGKWLSGGAVLDSIKVDTYLSGIESLTSSNFYDKSFDVSEATSSVEYTLDNGGVVKLSSYAVDTLQIIQSSVNLDSYFEDKALGEKVFVGLKGLQ